MSEPLNRVKVNIAGEEYIIRSSVSESKILEVADYVGKKLEEVSGGVSVSEKYRTAVLAALNIAGELFEERQKGIDISEKLNNFMNKAKELSERMAHTIP